MGARSPAGNEVHSRALEAVPSGGMVSELDTPVITWGKLSPNTPCHPRWHTRCIVWSWLPGREQALSDQGRTLVGPWNGGGRGTVREPVHLSERSSKMRPR